MAKVKRTRRGIKAASGNPILVLILVGGALYVNWEFITKALGFSSQPGNSYSSPQGPSKEETHLASSASPSPGAAALFQPVGMEEEVPNPFDDIVGQATSPHPDEGAEDPGDSKPVQGAGSEPAPGLPKGVRLSLVLLRGKSRSAVIGGKLVGEGDRLPFGKVLQIREDRVLLEGSGGARILLPLRKAPLMVRVHSKGQGEGPDQVPSQPAVPPRRETKEPEMPAVPPGPMNPKNPKNFLKLLQGFPPPASQGKE